MKDINTLSQDEYCHLCGQRGAHYCVGKLPPNACNVDFPYMNKSKEINQYGNFTPKGYRMSQKEIADFAKWMKENQPVLNGDDYWELLAYRIVAKLGV